MVGTITPVVYGPTRFSTWYRLMSVYTLSQIIGAALTGSLLAVCGMLSRTLYPWELSALTPAMGILSGIGAMHDMKLLPFRAPSLHWQVPQSWKRFAPSVMAACYGFGIGLGVLTRIPFASFYIVLVACTGMANLPYAVGLMALYGATRAGAVALCARGQAFARDPHQRLMTIAHMGPVIGYLNGIVLAAVAGFLLGTLAVRNL